MGKFVCWLLTLGLVAAGLEFAAEGRSFGAGAYPLNPVMYFVADGALHSARVTAYLARYIVPEDFALAADADDSPAFGRWRAWIDAGGLRAGQLTKGRVYNVSAAVNLTGLSGFDFDLRGATIQNTHSNYAVLDVLGTGQSHVHDGTVICGSQQTPCYYGVQIGRANMTQGQEGNSLDRLVVDGYYVRGAVFNNGELFKQDQPRYFNKYVGGNCNSTTAGLDSCGYAFIEDGVNHWPVQSDYASVVLTANTYVSFNESIHEKPVFYNQGNGPAVWTAGSRRHEFRKGYVQVQGAGGIPGLVMYFETEQTSQEADRVYGFVWDMHEEIQPQALIQFTGGPGAFAYVEGLTLRDHLVQSVWVFDNDASITDVEIFGLAQDTPRFQVPGQPHEASQPAQFRLVGDVFISEALSPGVWNGPLFSGVFTTDDRNGFAAGQTINAGGNYSIRDPAGIRRPSLSVQGSSSFNPFVSLGAGESSTPYVSFGGNGVADNTRIINDANGRLSVTAGSSLLFQFINGAQAYAPQGLTSPARVSALGSLQLGATTGNALPFPAQLGDTVLCTNCRKPGEPAGSGSGMVVTWMGSGWFDTTGGGAAQ